MSFCTNGFVPENRSGHESVLIGNKLYIMGGFDSISPLNSISREIYYLDLSSPFDIDNPPFVDLTKTSPMLYEISKVTSLAGSIGNSLIFLTGGTKKYMTDQFVFIYNVYSQRWEIAQGAQPTRSISTVTDQFVASYIFRAMKKYYMLAFWGNYIKCDVSNSICPPRSHATATLLQDGKIIYIGGANQQSFGNKITLRNMLDISIYDTQSLTWSLMEADTPFTIHPRVGHTAVLAPNSKSIILLGGTSSLLAMHPQAIYSSRFISNNDLDSVHSQAACSSRFISHNELKVICPQMAVKKPSIAWESARLLLIFSKKIRATLFELTDLKDGKQGGCPLETSSSGWSTSR
ncbi:22798_t:CDS:2, partial [Dentiscutata erythropus]